MKSVLACKNSLKDSLTQKQKYLFISDLIRE
jgi:hypothetical protein